METEIEKIYWSIGEVAAMFNVNTTTLRYWEDYFEIATARKRSGARQFVAKDLEKIGQIKHLVIDRMFTLKGAKKEMENNLNQIK
jgi:DNA-binding transcriptional MerR regulator